MKIAFIVTRFDQIGGAQIHVKDLALRLASEGNSVTVITGGEADPEYVRLFSEKGIELRVLSSLQREIKGKRDIRALREVKEVLGSIAPDIISLHSSKAGLLGRLAARKLPSKVLFTAHGWSFTSGIGKLKRLVYGIIETVASHFGDAIITVSSYDYELAMGVPFFAKKKLICIHNGMPDIPEERRARPGGKGASAADAAVHAPVVKIVMVGRFLDQKDHRGLLKVLKDLDHLPWSLCFIGEGPKKSEVESYARELGIAERVVFHGQIATVPDVLAEAHVFALFSNWEGLPRSIIEAMRAGLPVIASGVGGVRELVEHETTGFVLSVNTGPQVRESMEALLTRPELRKRFGEKGREKYEQYFTFEHMYTKTFELYKNLWSQK